MSEVERLRAEVARLTERLDDVKSVADDYRARVVALEQRAERAEAACTQMRVMLNKWGLCPPPVSSSDTITDEFMRDVAALRLHDAGLGYLSPDKVVRVREVIDELLTSGASIVGDGRLSDDVRADLYDALALLGGAT